MMQILGMIVAFALVMSMGASAEGPDDLALPELLRTSSGNLVTTSEGWREQRRPELLELFRTHIYGRAPVKRPDNLAFEVAKMDPRALDGHATRKNIVLTFSGPGGKGRIRLHLFVPNKTTRPVSCFLLICHRDPRSMDYTRKHRVPFWPVENIVARGHAAAVFNVGDVDPDRDDGFQNGVHKIFQQPGSVRKADAWATIAAWAWGASRCMDYFETDPDIDTSRCAVVGHSRGGKTALWCGAEDERFSLVVSNSSGCTGAALARRKQGESVQAINNGFPHWFCDNYNKYNNKEDTLPVDQHMLIALQAPRLVYVASASKDTWADPLGEFLACLYAGPAFRLFGLDGVGTAEQPPINTPTQTGHIAYHLREGKHDLTLYDWQQFMTFAEMHWN